ncbi:alpha/beta hydrolase [Pseudonocardia sp. GCM10023141]|uniref:alpha/beta hydrolase n=1 Tax=Pseudonocardia sp. GCM10023141 TaxID=3252653 RepID=UPI0036223552
MRGRTLGTATVAALALPACLVGAGRASASTPPTAAPDSPRCRPRTAPPAVGLTPVSATPVDARTTMYAFRSAAVGTAMPDGLVHVRVTLPVSYDGAATRRYPVLVHLHGANNSPATWPAAEVEQVIGDTPVILVQPDGGPSGLYSDWYGTPITAGDPQNGGDPFPPPAWETSHIRELLPWVDQTFRTTGHRAVAGSSMGGLGAMSYPARNPGVFDAAASLSGAVNSDALFPVLPLLQLISARACGVTASCRTTSGRPTTRPRWHRGCAASRCTSRRATAWRARTTTWSRRSATPSPRCSSAA